MGNVYAAVFSNKIVKFGRSSNVLKRIREHNTLAHHHDASVTKVLISPVMNEVREERTLLDAADGMIEPVSQESFRFENLLEVKMAFDDARLEFLLFRVRENPFELVLDQYDNGTDFEFMSWEKDNTKKSDRRSAVCDEVLDCFKRFDKLKYSEIRSMLSARQPITITNALNAMIRSEELDVKYHRDIFTGYVSTDIKRAVFSKKAKRATV